MSERFGYVKKPIQTVQNGVRERERERERAQPKEKISNLEM